MSFELALLAWSPALLALYVGAQGTLYRVEHGVGFSVSGRDDEPPAHGHYLQRSEKALRNFLETYGAFIALAVVAELGQHHGLLTAWGASLWFAGRLAYLPLYLLGVPYLRSLAWSVAALGLALLFFGVIV
jgi:uncharacterized MAPEG superfamily protein